MLIPFHPQATSAERPATQSQSGYSHTMTRHGLELLRHASDCAIALWQDGDLEIPLSPLPSQDEEPLLERVLSTVRTTTPIWLLTKVSSMTTKVGKESLAIRTQLSGVPTLR